VNSVKIESSYQKNNIGKSIYETVIKYKPKVIVEFGVLEGYSTINMANALKEIGSGHIYSYDLWDKYLYKHSTKENTLENIKRYGCEDLITLGDVNFYEWVENPTCFDLLHIDISNDGEIIELAYNNLKSFIDRGSIVIFEGGTPERDKEKWMTDYNKKPIFPLKKKIGYNIINDKWPGLSIMSIDYNFQKSDTHLYM
jgi:predicted O-methyltransferase YrrM